MRTHLGRATRRRTVESRESREGKEDGGRKGEVMGGRHARAHSTTPHPHLHTIHAHKRRREPEAPNLRRELPDTQLGDGTAPHLPLLKNRYSCWRLLTSLDGDLMPADEDATLVVSFLDLRRSHGLSRDTSLRSSLLSHLAAGVAVA